MDTWNRLADLRRDGGERTGLKKVQGLAKAHVTCIAHGHRQQGGEGWQRAGVGWRWATAEGERGVSVIVPTIKNNNNFKTSQQTKVQAKTALIVNFSKN